MGGGRPCGFHWLDAHGRRRQEPGGVPGSDLQASRLRHGNCGDRGAALGGRGFDRASAAHRAGTAAVGRECRALLARLRGGARRRAYPGAGRLRPGPARIRGPLPLDPRGFGLRRPISTTSPSTTTATRRWSPSKTVPNPTPNSPRRTWSWTKTPWATKTARAKPPWSRWTRTWTCRNSAPRASPRTRRISARTSWGASGSATNTRPTPTSSTRW